MPTTDILLDKTVQIVSAYVSCNQLEIGKIPSLVEETFRSLKKISADQIGPVPAVPIDSSVTDDFLICLEDGEQVTLLKRYLQNHHDMSPEEYRAKWGLPEDYPFVAKSYSIKRSQIAKEQGLGKS